MAAVRAGICEDDHELRGVVRDALVREGFEVTITSTGADAVRAFSNDPPDILVLDIGLPDSDGRDVCQALRARGVTSPVLFLTAKGALTDRLSGFHAGGDDYLAKPFALAELVIRLQALVRRSGRDGTTELEDSSFVLDPLSHALVDGDVRIGLTPTEFRLLAALASRRGQLARRHELIAAGWPDGAVVHDNTLDAYLARIRRKLRHAGSPGAIETARGVGYILK
jgi:two-component system, OmpR family, response regulator